MDTNIGGFGLSLETCKDFVLARIKQAREYRRWGNKYGRKGAAYALEDATAWYQKAVELAGC